MADAFGTYLSGSGPYYVMKADTDLYEAIALIRGAGGAPVLAHPGSRGAAQVLTDGQLADLAGAGLTGLEVDHPDHDAATRARLRTVADRLGLLATGASDYHGGNKSLAYRTGHHLRGRGRPTGRRHIGSDPNRRVRLTPMLAILISKSNKSSISKGPCVSRNWINNP